MMKLFMERLSWAVAFTVTIAFFLPWLKEKGHAMKDRAAVEQAKEEMVEEANLSWMETYFTLRPNETRDALMDPLRGTSGFSLLLLTRSENNTDREQAHQLVKYLGTQDLREASVLIYAIPAFTLIGACFFSAAAAGRLVFAIPMGLCALLYALMRSRLSETYLDRSVQDYSAGLGLWICLYGLLAMALLLAMRTGLGLSQK